MAGKLASLKQARRSSGDGERGEERKLSCLLGAQAPCLALPSICRVGGHARLALHPEVTPGGAPGLMPAVLHSRPVLLASWALFISTQMLLTLSLGLFLRPWQFQVLGNSVVNFVLGCCLETVRQVVLHKSRKESCVVEVKEQKGAGPLPGWT